MAFVRPAYREAVIFQATTTLAGLASLNVDIDLKDRINDTGWDEVLLFIGYAPGATPADGMSINVYPSFDSGAKGSFATTAVYNSDPFTIAAQGRTTVNGNSAAGQAILNVASSANFAAGDATIVGAGTAREELGVVSSTGVGTITLVNNLSYAHTAVQADGVLELQIRCVDWTKDILYMGATYLRLKLTNDDGDAGDNATVFVRGTGRRGYETFAL